MPQSHYMGLLQSAISIMFSFLLCEFSKQLIIQDVLNFFCNVPSAERSD